MKIAPTLEGGLRIDVEGEDDWTLIEAIIDDAVGERNTLAERLAKRIVDEDVVADWKEFVVPDLHAEFQTHILAVLLAIERARRRASRKAGYLRITRDEGPMWYSSLNQARLALEDHYQFGASEDVELESIDPAARAGFFRSQFYCAFQSLLLDHVM